MGAKESAVVLNFKVNGQVEYAKTIKDINAIMNAAAKEYKAHIKAMGDDASATDKLTAQKKKLETQLEAGRERTEKLRAEFVKMQNDTKTTTAQLNNMYGKVKDSEAAEASLERQLSKVNQELSSQSEESRKNQSELNKLQEEAKQLESQSEKLTSEFKLQESALGDNASEAERAALAQEKFGKQSEMVERQISNLEAQLKITKAEYGENSIEANKMETELNEAKTAFNSLNNEMKETKGSADQAQNGMGQVTNMLQSQIFMEASQQLSQISEKLREIGQESIETAATFQANEAQFDQVFGGLVPKAQKIVEDLGDEFGILPNRLKPAYAAITSQFTSLGFGLEDAMGLASAATTSAADAAAFYDKSLADAQERVQSFLKGNLSAAESIGIFASVTTLEQYAMDNLGESYQKMDEKQKQAVRMDYVTTMQEMAGATGQAAREADGYENVMGNLENSVDEVKNALGEELLATFLELAKVMIPALKGFADWFKELSPGVKRFILVFAGVITVAGALLPILASLAMVAAAAGVSIGALVVGTILPAIAVIAAIAAAIAGVVMVVKNWGAITDWISDKWSQFTAFLSQKFDEISEATGKLIQAVAEEFGEFFDIMGEWFSGIGSWFSELGDSISGWFKKTWDEVSQSWNNFIGGIVGYLTDMKDAFDTKMTEIGSAISEKFNEIKENTIETWNKITDFLSKVGKRIYDFIMVPVSLLQTAFEAAWLLIRAVFDIAWEAIKIAITAVLDTVVKPVVNFIMDILTKLYDSIQSLWSFISTSIQLIIDSISSAVKQAADVIVNVFTTIGDWLLEKWEAIKEMAFSIWQTVKMNIVQPISEAKDAAIEKVSEIWARIVEIFSNIVIETKEKWNNVKQAVIDKFTETKQVTVDIASNIWQGIVDKFTKIVDTAKEKFNAVKDAIVGPLIAAKDKVAEVIESIRNFFADMKLPKFSLKTSSKTVLGKEITYPSGIDVKWNAKGGIFTQPTIFGASGGTLQGIGEAGPEAALPLNEETLGAIGRGIAATMGGPKIEQHNHFGKVDMNNPSEQLKLNRQLYQAGVQSVLDKGGIPG